MNFLTKQLQNAQSHNVEFEASNVQVYPTLCTYCNGPFMSIDCKLENPFAQAQPPQLPQGQNLSIAEMVNAHAKFMDDAKHKVNKSLLQGNFLITIERASVRRRFGSS